MSSKFTLLDTFCQNWQKNTLTVDVLLGVKKPVRRAFSPWRKPDALQRKSVCGWDALAHLGG
ncbi:MAG: hypothetical protein RL536_487 [Candidatus Parcubacteria bacterium]|jgi:hypothetical protein